MDKKIINREEIIEQLAELLMTFAKKCNEYQTDVYIHFDPNTNTAKLDTVTVVNGIGSHSRPNDDSHKIYYDWEHYCKQLDVFFWAFYGYDYLLYEWDDKSTSEDIEDEDIEDRLDAKRVKDILGMSIEDFDKEVLDNLVDYDRDYECVARGNYEIDWYDRYNYSMKRKDYASKLVAAYDKHIDEHRADYVKKAEKIFDNYDLK